MVLLDVNVLLYAFRVDSSEHSALNPWLTELANGESPFGLSDTVLAGFIRIATNPRVFDPPSPIEDALAYADGLRSRPNCVRIAPGPRHWAIFSRLCLAVGAKGNLVPDAYLAALAIESGSEWVTTDRDFSRFPGLRWRHALD